MNKEDFYDKVDWEGGVMGAIEYGLTSNDMPPDTPGAVKTAWDRLVRDFKIINEWLY
ncbi:MAG: hypothetical protein V3W37_08140 [Candidatus Binatia bacterium]